MINKMLLGTLAMALAIPGASAVLDQIKPQSEYYVVYHSIDTTLQNAMAINQINPTTDIDTALDTALKENHKAEGMYLQDSTLYYTVGDTCLKGSIVDDWTNIRPCDND